MPKVSAQSTRAQVVSHQYNLRSRDKSMVQPQPPQKKQPTKKRYDLRTKEKYTPTTAEERRAFIQKFTEEHMDSYLAFMAKYFPNGPMHHGLP